VSDDDERPVDLVATVGELDPAVAALREFVHVTHATRAMAVVERTDGASPAVIDCGRLAPIEVDLGDRLVHLPHAIELDASVPVLPAIPATAPLQIDADAGDVIAPIGFVARLADAVQALAAALGGRNVALAQWATTDPEAPLAISARADGSEALVVSLGEQEYELPG
jgi:hypothetical protein